MITTEREGNAKAIMEQKNSIESKRVLATDTFGSISEGNVDEFLKYLPGVRIEYVEADARSVSPGLVSASTRTAAAIACALTCARAGLKPRAICRVACGRRSELAKRPGFS